MVELGALGRRLRMNNRRRDPQWTRPCRFASGCRRIPFSAATADISLRVVK